jgi:signal peptidase I
MEPHVPGHSLSEGDFGPLPWKPRKPRSKAEQAREETPLEAFASICTVLVIGLFALTFIFQNFEIPSSSMEKTLLVGDHVLVDRITLAPRTAWAPFVYYRNVRRGDIIVFFKPGEPDLYLVKRVIGVPGDRIHLRNGVVFLNGQPQHEPQAAMPDYGNYFPYRDDFPAVPPSQSGDVTPPGPLELPNYIQGRISWFRRAATLPWAITAPSASTAAIGALCPEPTSSAARLFVYWSFIEPDNQYEKEGVGDKIRSIPT